MKFKHKRYLFKPGDLVLICQKPYENTLGLIVGRYRAYSDVENLDDSNGDYVWDVLHFNTFDYDSHKNKPRYGRELELL